MKIISIEKENSIAVRNDYREFGQAKALASYKLHQTDFTHELYFKADEYEAIIAWESPIRPRRSFLFNVQKQRSACNLSVFL